MRIFAKAVILPGLLFAGVGTAFAYDGAAAATYASSWCNTNYENNPRGNANHVNNLNAVHGGPGNYTWWYKERQGWWLPFTGTTVNLSNDGDNSVPIWKGSDCTNFASQVLSTGGVTLSNVDDATRGTFIKRARLGRALRNSANVQLVDVPSRNSNPAALQKGDLIELPYMGHMMVIVATNPITLAYHSTDRCGIKLKDLPAPDFWTFWLPAGWGVQGYHITGNSIAGITDPDAAILQLKHLQGIPIADGGYAGDSVITAVLTDAESGVSALSVTAGAPVIDDWTNALYGFADPVFYDGTYNATSSTYTIDLSRLTEGTSVYIHGFNGAGEATIQSFQIERVPPAIALFDANGAPLVYASSMTQVTVKGTDATAGIDRITLLNPDNTTSTQTFSGQLVAYATFTSLTQNGSYTAYVYDRGNNHASVAFSIDTVASTVALRDGMGHAFAGDVITSSSCAQFRIFDAGSGVRSASLTCNNGYKASTATFSPPANVAAWSGGICGLSGSTCTVHIEDYADNKADYAFAAATVAAQVTLTGSTASWYNEDSVIVSTTAACTQNLTFSVQHWGAFEPPDVPRACATIYTVINGREAICDGQAEPKRSIILSQPYPSTLSYYVKNTTPVAGAYVYIRVNAKLGDWEGAQFDFSGKLQYNEELVGNVVLPQVVCSTYSHKLFASTFTVESPIDNITLSTSPLSAAQLVAAQQQVLRLAGGKAYVTDIEGAFGVFNGTITLTLNLVDDSASTPTMRLYEYSGGIWSSGPITNQSLSKDGSGIITAVGLSTHTGIIAVLFSGIDTSSPTTTLATTGSSYTWGGTLFVSTDSYVVLTATDTPQDGYASGVSTIYYRSSASDDFSVYADSVPLPVGTYFFQYRTSDWAGNLESIKTSTFVVTNRTVTQLSGGFRVSGDMLVGYSTSGARFEVEAGGYSNYVLRISSPDNATMAAVDFIGNIGLGMESGDGRLSISSNAAQGDIALQLRSGNSTGSVTSSQITMGYNGQSSMRDVIRTQHNSIADGNRMDFLVWEPSVGSTATLAGLDVMSLEASTVSSRALVHIHPTSTRSQDVELIVSSSTEGGGVIRCKETVGTSAKGSKDDIRYLTTKDEDRALADIASLQPVRFRYKKQGSKGELLPDPSQPLRRGYIYEDAPASIKVAGAAISIDERIANAEMALKASMRKLEKLQKRLAEIQARKKK